MWFVGIIARSLVYISQVVCKIASAAVWWRLCPFLCAMGHALITQSHILVYCYVLQEGWEGVYIAGLSDIDMSSQSIPFFTSLNILPIRNVLGWPGFLWAWASFTFPVLRFFHKIGYNILNFALSSANTLIILCTWSCQHNLEFHSALSFQNIVSGDQSRTHSWIKTVLWNSVWLG